MNDFEKAKQAYAAYGVDVEAAFKKAASTPISIQCWQLDDVIGFENSGSLTGGIQATGDYPGRARNYEEMVQDLDKALSLIPGKKKINLHAIYESDDVVDRKDITEKNFARWIEYAKKNGLGLDFNPTCFSSSHMHDGCSLSSNDDATRKYWIEHCVNSIKVSEAFAKATGQRCLCNIWIPDGMKEDPADRFGPRKRLVESLDEILSHPYDKNLVDVAVESKVFGIGIESYTVGSNEFYLGYSVSRQILCLLDMGHFHPTENVADKISSLLCYLPRIALHVSRPVRWDSDHVIRYNDDLKAVFDELARNDAYDRTDIGLDYFDASINRVAALVIGSRNAQKALLNSLLTPWDLLKKAQDDHDHTKLLQLSEDLKTLPFGEVFAEYCAREGVPADGKWYGEIEEYEKSVLALRK